MPSSYKLFKVPPAKWMRGDVLRSTRLPSQRTQHNTQLRISIILSYRNSLTLRSLPFSITVNLSVLWRSNALQYISYCKVDCKDGSNDWNSSYRIAHLILRILSEFHNKKRMYWTWMYASTRCQAMIRQIDPWRAWRGRSITFYLSMYTKNLYITVHAVALKCSEEL